MIQSKMAESLNEDKALTTLLKYCVQLLKQQEMEVAPLGLELRGPFLPQALVALGLEIVRRQLLVDLRLLQKGPPYAFVGFLGLLELAGSYERLSEEQKQQLEMLHDRYATQRSVTLWQDAAAMADLLVKEFGIGK